MDSKRDKIIASYEWNNDDDISTERLLAMVADDCGCDVSRVAEVLGEYWESIKLNNPDGSLLTEDSTTKGIVDTDLISRQAAIEAMAPFDTNHELRDTLESLPPVEPPKKVVAQIKVDTEEIVERIKEEYEFTERPKGEWIENDDFTCSECGYHMIVGGGAYNFCPNCGCQMERADMRGDKDV